MSEGCCIKPEADRSKTMTMCGAVLLQRADECSRRLSPEVQSRVHVNMTDVVCMVQGPIASYHHGTKALMPMLPMLKVMQYPRWRMLTLQISRHRTGRGISLCSSKVCNRCDCCICAWDSQAGTLWSCCAQCSTCSMYVATVTSMQGICVAMHTPQAGALKACTAAHLPTQWQRTTREWSNARLVIASWAVTPTNPLQTGMQFHICTQSTIESCHRHVQGPLMAGQRCSSGQAAAGGAKPQATALCPLRLASMPLEIGTRPPQVWHGLCKGFWLRACAQMLAEGHCQPRGSTRGMLQTSAMAAAHTPTVRLTTQAAARWAAMWLTWRSTASLSRSQSLLSALKSQTYGTMGIARETSGWGREARQRRCTLIRWTTFSARLQVSTLRPDSLLLFQDLGYCLHCCCGPALYVLSGACGDPSAPVLYAHLIVDEYISAACAAYAAATTCNMDFKRFGCRCQVRQAV